MDDPPNLIGGPYMMPNCSIGDVLADARRGPVVVEAISKSPVPWPVGRKAAKHKGRPGVILCGDLLRAVRTESEQAIGRHWGVSRSVVVLWRRFLGAGRVTPGTRSLLSAVRADEGAKRADAWTPQEEAILGTDFDAAIAKKIGRSQHAVTQHRIGLGITAWRSA